MDIPDSDIENPNREIASKEELIAFVYALQNDLKDRPEEWDNRDLDSFLGALAAFLGDADGYYQNAKINFSANTPSWRLFADCLRAARVYE